MNIIQLALHMTSIKYVNQQEIEHLRDYVKQLEANEKELTTLIQATGIGIWDWQIDTGETKFNQRWADIIGYQLTELEPLSIDTWVKYAHPDDLVESNQRLTAHWQGETSYYECESRMRHKEGHWIWVLDTGKVVEWHTNGQPKRMIGTHLDISERKYYIDELERLNQQLLKLSYDDPLTKLHNRRAYEEKIQSEISALHRHQMPLSMIIIDVDYFKEYNDYHGHKLGDQVLI